MRLRIATRRSPLALWQAEHVAGRLRRIDGVEDVTLVPIVTVGDRILDKTLSKIGGKGLFIKELEQAMLDGAADLAVHSMKDVPARPPAGFAFPAVLEREDPRDALVGSTLDGLAQGATVGTSSLRRQAQLKALRPDLVVRPVRGNVQTRLARCDSGDFAAIMLAVAGLKRLELDSRIAEAMEPARMLPAAGQGIVGIECLADADGVLDVLAGLNDADSAAMIRAERAVAAGLDADCHAPVGAHARLGAGGSLTLDAIVASPDGTTLLRARAAGDAADATAIGDQVVAGLLEQGAAEIIRRSATT